ncbi:J domain-containing protein [Clavibacter phaseoli]|uniref:J domain-containing protein n=1 Tax=Clavibacter phaseoli TaxID=1734031 RepID=UPI000E66018E|nr:J domain-containing protein [Clavibacter phaseoli]RIJ57686.1 J domain-containing protein [Clavibacter phaseoli]UKF30555.1 J domain-containing protein [Clavibacter phaseoli]UKF36473.1 J domain-containing protein [Clavibacter phaseoli]
MDPSSAAALLGVDADADRPTISRAYLRRARETHPDRLPGASPQQLRTAHERFVQLTLARDVLMLRRHATTGHSAPPATGQGSAHRGRTPPSPPRPHPTSERLSPYGRSRRERARRGLGPSIAAVCALAGVLVVVVSFQDSTRARFTTVGADLTQGATVVTVEDPATRASECVDTSSCTLLDMTAPEDCSAALVRFEVTTGRSDDGRETESRELGAVRAGSPARVVLGGVDPELVYLGCEPG